jgi:hypothetical protein
MDEFIRQAYADGMMNDDSHIAPNPIDYNPPPPPPSPPSSYYTAQPSTTTNQVPISNDELEELILISDDDESHSSQMNIPLPSSSFSYNQSFHLSSPVRPPPPPVRAPVVKVSLPYTYLSLIPRKISSSNTNYQDFTIKGCFSTIVSNPRIIKNEFDLRANLNDGSDCLLVRLASDFITQHIGITVTELITKRNECKSITEKQKFQADFNERFKQFGHEVERLNTMMTIRFFSDNQIPMVIKIDEN